jgi:hypothetical protein
MPMTAFTIAWHVATIGGLACSAASASCAGKQRATAPPVRQHQL